MAMIMMMVVVVVTPFSSAAELTPVNTKEIVEELIAHPPTRFPLLFAVLPNKELITIISGPDADPNHFRKIEGAVIFRQPLASMTTGGPILQEGAGRLLAELYPDLPGYYKGSGLGAVCFEDQDLQDQDHPVQCLLFMQHDHVENESGGSVVTFDLLVPFDGTAPEAATKGCVRKGEFWPRTANRIIPLPVDRLNQYFSYRARVQDHLNPDEEAFYLNSSLAKTTLVAARPKKACSVDSAAAPLNVAQGPTVNKSLCNVQGKNQFTLQEEGCGGLAFDKKFTAGFVVADEGGGDLLKGVFLLPTFDSFQVMILPAEVIADLDQALKVGVCDGPKWVNRDDFWKKWNSFKADSCETEPVPTTAAPPTTTGKSTTTTTTSTTTSSTSTTTKKTTGKVVPDGNGSTTTATSSSSGNITSTSTPNNVTASVNGSTSHSEVDSTTGKAMLYIIIGVFVLVVVLVLILITVICIWSKRGKSGQEKGGKGAKEDKSVSRATSSAASSKVPSKVAASKVPSKVGGKAAPSKMKAKESATKQSKQQPLKAAPSKAAAAAGGGKAPVKAGPKGAKGKGTSNALGSSFQTSAVA